MPLFLNSGAFSLPKGAACHRGLWMDRAIVRGNRGTCRRRKAVAATVAVSTTSCTPTLSLAVDLTTAMLMIIATATVPPTLLLLPR